MTYSNNALYFHEIIEQYCFNLRGPHSRQKHQSYIETFSIENWEKLLQSAKEKHRLSSCLECALKQTDLQQAFSGPTFKPIQNFTSDVESLSLNTTASQLTQHVLSELQPVYEKAYGMSFTTVVSECAGSGLQQKPTKVERRGKRRIQQEVRDHINGQMRATDATNVLEGLSLKSYKRLRLAQAFETPEAKRNRYLNNPTSERKHSPKFENVTWDKEQVLADLRQWPVGNTINWSEFARQHSIPGRNGGQVAKEFAKENGIDVFSIDNRLHQQG